MSKTQFLTREEEYALAVRYKGGDRAAGERILIAHRPLAYKIAKFSKCPVPEEERRQFAMIGMAKSLDSFDPERTYEDPTLGTQKMRFSTFAAWKIGMYLIDMTRMTVSRKDTDGSPLRASLDDLDDENLDLIPDFFQTGRQTGEDLLMIAEKNADQQKILDESMDELDAMEAEILRDVILTDKRVAAAPIVKKHGRKITVTEAKANALANLTAIVQSKVHQLGLTDSDVQK